ncbi:MAG TPA: GDSL-type esterase/lipase family protein [Vicinamibacterales bacterium]|nr:GDSL-type esterase/lipase family protein [Vicinamibacterales bacterium]
MDRGHRRPKLGDWRQPDFARHRRAQRVEQARPGRAGAERGNAPDVSPVNTDILIPDLIGLPAQNVSAEQIIQRHQQIISRARAMGLRVYGATLPPVEGFPFPGFWTPVMEEKRQLVNRFVRRSGAYDAVIDFDAVLRDPAQPTRLRPEYDSSDHVHPNDLGHRAMAEAIDLKLFRGTDD